MGFADHGVAPEIVERNQPFIARTGLGWAVFQAHFIDQNGGGGVRGDLGLAPKSLRAQVAELSPMECF